MNSFNELDALRQRVTELEMEVAGLKSINQEKTQTNQQLETEIETVYRQMYRQADVIRVLSKRLTDANLNASISPDEKPKLGGASATSV